MLYKSLQLEEFDKGQIIFHYGDSGSTFYIIISGEVEIKVPAVFELDGLECTAEAVLAFLVTFQEDIYWVKMPNGDKIKKELDDELKKFNLHQKDSTPE